MYDLREKRGKLKSGACRATHSGTDFSRAERGEKPGGNELFGVEAFPPNPHATVNEGLVLTL